VRVHHLSGCIYFSFPSQVRVVTLRMQSGLLLHLRGLARGPLLWGRGKRRGGCHSGGPEWDLCTLRCDDLERLARVVRARRLCTLRCGDMEQLAGGVRARRLCTLGCGDIERLAGGVRARRLCTLRCGDMERLAGGVRARRLCTLGCGDIERLGEDVGARGRGADWRAWA